MYSGLYVVSTVLFVLGVVLYVGFAIKLSKDMADGVIPTREDEPARS